MKRVTSKILAGLLCTALFTADLLPLAAAQQQEVTQGEVVTSASDAEETVTTEKVSEDIFVEETVHAAGASYYDSVEDGAVAEDGYFIRKVSKTDLNANSKALQAVLDEAAVNATAKAPYKIVVEPASYTIGTALTVPGNTYLYLDGVTFKQEKNADANMLKVKGVNVTETGYCYENITIYGGTFDKNGNAGTTLMKVGHAANFTIENVTMTNIKNAHFMEVGGVNGFTMRKCTLKNATVTSSSKITAFEAVQFDVLVDGHINGYEYEDIMSKNIVVEDSVFQNVSSGVGSHNAILNNPIRDIVIRNNKFQTLKCVAISFMDARNCEITGNTITAAPRGIFMRCIQQGATFFGSSLNKKSTLSKNYQKPETDQKIVISGNTISCSGSNVDSSYATCCIFLVGRNVTAQKKTGSGDKMPKGDYYISGAVVSNNNLTTTEESIVLWDTKNSTIDSNTLTCKGAKTAVDMIKLENASTDNVITNNAVNKSLKNGIALHTGSSARMISGNTMTNPGYSGILLETGSSAKTISGNTIKNPGYCGILIEASTTETISGNKITKPKGGGIILNNRSCAKSITKNTITSAGADGINVANTKDNLEISGNTVKSCASSQILINYATKKTVTISKNKLTGKKDADGILCTSGTLFVSNNTISSCRFAILLTDNVKGTVVYNTCKKNQNNNVNIGFGEMKKYMSKPGSVKAKASGSKAAQISWKKVKGAAGYQVFRATSKNGTYTKVANVKKTSYKDSKLKAKTTYYYKVVAYQNSNNKNLSVAGDYSKPVSVKTK